MSQPGDAGYPADPSDYDDHLAAHDGEEPTQADDDLVAEIEATDRESGMGGDDRLIEYACDGCTCCRQGHCYRGARSDCRYSDQLGYLCPCTEDR